MPLLRHPSLYASFDRFPSTKGAGTHIGHMAHTLFQVSGGGALCVLGDEELPEYQNEFPIEIFRFRSTLSNFLERSAAFSRMVHEIIESQRESLRICHFRDPWSGVPVIAQQDRNYAAIYEINGLPSIELPYTYPQVGASTLEKIRTLEQQCWMEADLVITPSETMKANLLILGLPAEKVVVVPNGADISENEERPSDAPERYILYFGALQPWQGVDMLMRAFALVADFEDLKLVICCSHHPRQAKPYVKLAERLGIAERILWRHRLPRPELRGWISHALLSVAPLTECSRNLQQGCCPLKVLESMAAGVPVVGSDIPAVRELIRNNFDGRLVRPGRPSELARALRVLLEYPDEIVRMGRNARQRIQEKYTWQQSLSKLAAIYQSFLKQSSFTKWPTGGVYEPDCSV